MSKDQWVDAFERVGKDFADGKITRAGAEHQLKMLGFDAAGIAVLLDALEAEMAKP